jgi:hypothetical protein
MTKMRPKMKMKTATSMLMITTKNTTKPAMEQNLAITPLMRRR